MFIDPKQFKTFRKKKISAGLMLNTRTKADKVCLAPGLFFFQADEDSCSNAAG